MLSSVFSRRSKMATKKPRMLKWLPRVVNKTVVSTIVASKMAGRNHMRSLERKRM